MIILVKSLTKYKVNDSYIFPTQSKKVWNLTKMFQSLSLENGSVTTIICIDVNLLLLKSAWIHIHKNSVNCGRKKFGKSLEV